MQNIDAIALIVAIALVAIIASYLKIMILRRIQSIHSSYGDVISKMKKTINSQASSIKELREDEANIIVQLQRAEKKLSAKTVEAASYQKKMQEYRKAMVPMAQTISASKKWIHQHDFRGRTDLDALGYTSELMDKVREVLKDDGVD